MNIIEDPENLHDDLIKKSEQDNKLFLQQLENLIQQTYVIEEEYKHLNGSYQQLQNTIEQLIEFLPNALWILYEENGKDKIFLQNSKAEELSDIFEKLNLTENDYEIEYNKSSYLIKIARHKDKTLISATDNTEYKRKERLITMGQMAAHLSHEIRNPTASISLLSSTLLKRVGFNEKPLVFEMQKSVFRIERIIKATLMFSKGIQANKEKCLLSKIQKDLEDAINFYSYTKPIDFIFDWEQSREIIVDCELLVILFSNFIFNAIDAIEADENETGNVTIEYSESNDKKKHLFKIYDTGIPIENEAILFEAFKSTKEKGNGLGLVLSQQITKIHGGYIKLIDELNLDKGFEIAIKK
jgi:two-component system NtrC family sensor kinase/two-component system sensor histidine kinase AtoS